MHELFIGGIFQLFVNQMGQFLQGEGYCRHCSHCQSYTNRRHLSNNQIKCSSPKMLVQNSLENHLRTILTDYHQRIQKAKEYGKKMNDPQKYKQFRKESFEIFIKNLSVFKFLEEHLNEQRICIKLLVGSISAGKSSLLNNLFNLQLEVGIGETTKQISKVYSKDGVEIYDSPGQNEIYNTTDFEQVKKLGNVHQVFIVYNNSLKNIEEMVRIILAVKPKTSYFIRTFCDRANESLNKTLEQEIATDYATLKSWNIENVKIYKTSAMVKNGFDNQQVKNILLKHPRKSSQQLCRFFDP